MFEFRIFYKFIYNMSFSFINHEEKSNNVIEINFDNFKEITENNKYLVFDFYATWCTPCKLASPEIEQLSKEYKNVKFCKINVDDNDLVNDYDIEYLPTIMVFKNDNLNKNIFKSESGDMKPLKEFLNKIEDI